MTAHLSFQTLAQLSAGRMLNGVIEGIAIAFLAWAMLRLGGRQGAVTRFAVWFAALIAVAALPFVGSISSGVAAGMSAPRPAITLPHQWAVYLFVAWAAIASVALAKLAAGLYRLVGLRQSCRVVDPATLDPMLRQTLQQFHSSRSVAVCTSESLSVPAALGFFKPAVVFPAWAMQELSPSELNSILLHELAHLARWDDWTNLAQKVLRAVLFFHPAVWWIEARLSLEREMACDDIVLAQTANPHAYAECLVCLTEKGLLRRGLNLAQAAISRVRQTTLRVTEILDKQRPRSTRISRPAVGVLAASAFACLSFAPHAPKLVSFESAAPSYKAAPASLSMRPVAASFSPNADAPAELRASETPGLTNAVFHPDSISRVRRTTTPSKPVKTAPRHNRVAWTVPAQYELANPAPPAQTVLVVMQDRFYDAGGQQLWVVSVFRVTTTHPNAGWGVTAKKI